MAVPAACRIGGSKGLVHDTPDRAGASPALGATAEAVIDIASGPRAALARGQCSTNVVVRKYVAGTDNHCARPGSELVRSETIIYAGHYRL